MAVVDSWDGTTRRIYLAQGTGGIVEVNPCADIYPEYREERRTDEGFRKWFPFVQAVGNEPKGGGKFTPRYLLLLDDGDIGQTKIVPYDEDSVINVTGEVLTEDQTSPFDLSTLSPGTNVVINYTPPTSEIIQLGVSGLTPEESAALIQTADEATLARKLADADETLAEGDTDNWVLIDSDDGVTVLRTRSVQDKDGNAITLAQGIPARRQKS